MTAPARPGARPRGRQGSLEERPGATRPLAVTGAMAACAVMVTGLVILTPLVLVGWIAAPHAGLGLTGVLRMATGVWLAAHHVGFALRGAGRIGLVSKSGTLTYQMMYELRDIGFSTAVGIGGDPVIGTTHIDCLRAFQDDPETDAIVMIGEIGGDAEERAAAYIEQNVSKPVVAYVAGFTAPEGKTMGHAGAIVSGSSGTAQAKKEALEKVGVRVGKTPSGTALLVREVMKSR